MGSTMVSLKVALVTGAGTGIGRNVSLALQCAGYQVVVAGRRAGELEKTAAMGHGQGPAMLVVTTDVSSPHSVEGLFGRIRESFGRLDLLFNNAGMNLPAVPMEDVSFEQWKQVVGVNLTGAFLCSQQAIKLMKQQEPRGGRIINNGSVSADSPRPHSAPYTATKHALRGLTKSISLDCRGYDIACGQIDIGNAAAGLSLASRGDGEADAPSENESTFDVSHVAEAIVYMAGLPLNANVQSMTLLATDMEFVGRG